MAIDPVKTILNWRARGLAVVLVDGAISIDPVSALNPTDRNMLRAHKAAIAAALRDIGVF